MKKILALLLLVAAPSAFAELQVLSGSSPQTAFANAVLPNPVRFRVIDGGVPVEGAWVTFQTGPGPGLSYGALGSIDYTECSGGDLVMVCSAVTGPDGIAQFVTLTSSFAKTFDIVANARDSTFKRDLGTATLGFTFVDGHGVLDLDLTNMWWGGPVENGWGMSVVKHGSQLFNVLFVYDSEGKPTWLVQPGGTWSAALGALFTGPVYSPRSAPWHSYDASKLVAGESVGRFTTRFFGREHSQLTVDMANRQFLVKNLERQDFTGDVASPMQGVADMWWGGPSQNGWGIAVLEQFGNLFLVWFTYGDDGRPTWFVMPGGRWTDSRSYSGSIYKTVGTDWIVGPYDASKLEASTVGNYTITFTAEGRATFGYVLEGRSGTLALERQAFD